MKRLCILIITACFLAGATVAMADGFWEQDNSILTAYPHPDRAEWIDFETYTTGTSFETYNPPPLTFEPQKDITAYELSQCLFAIFGGIDEYEKLKPESKRHFKLEEAK